MLRRKFPYHLNSIFTLLTEFENPTLILRYFTGIKRPTEPQQVKLRSSGLRFYVRNAMDIWSIKETFIDRFYERFDTPVEDGWTIIDVGAGLGDYTIFVSYRSLSNRVFAYEPFYGSFSLLEENLRLNGISTAQVFNQAVSGETGYLQLDLSGGEPLQIQSVDVEQEKSSSAGASVVPCLCLADVLSSNDLQRCDVLKLDCEGSEYSILFGARDDILARIDRIVMEYHDGITEYDHHDLAQYLREKGYRVKITANNVHTHLGYIYASRV